MCVELFELKQVDPWTAYIVAATSLRNKYGNYTLVINIRDLGVPPNVVTKSLDICISDFNDHAPIFISPLHNTTIRVPENATIGTMILQVMAIDDDIGMNAMVRYRLKPDPLGSYKLFNMDAESGEIFLKETLNRDKQKIHEVSYKYFY